MLMMMVMMYADDHADACMHRVGYEDYEAYGDCDGNGAWVVRVAMTLMTVDDEER